MAEKIHEFQCRICKDQNKMLKIALRANVDSACLDIEVIDLQTDETHSGNFTPQAIEEICNKIGHKLTFVSFLKQFIKQIILERNSSCQNYGSRVRLDSQNASTNSFSIITFQILQKYKAKVKSENNLLTNDLCDNADENSSEKIYLLFSALSDSNDAKTMNIPLALSIAKPKNMSKVVDNILQSCIPESDLYNSSAANSISIQTELNATNCPSNDFSQQFNFKALNTDLKCDNLTPNGCADYKKRYDKLKKENILQIQKITSAMNSLKDEMKQRCMDWKIKEDDYLTRINQLKKLNKSYQEMQISKSNRKKLSKPRSRPLACGNLEDDSDSNFSSDSNSADLEDVDDNIGIYVKKGARFNNKRVSLMGKSKRSSSIHEFDDTMQKGTKKQDSFCPREKESICRMIKPKLFNFEKTITNNQCERINSPKRIPRRNAPLKSIFTRSKSEKIVNKCINDGRHRKTNRTKRSSSSLSDKSAGSSSSRFKRFNPTEYINELGERRARSFSLRDSRLERARSLSRETQQSSRSIASSRSSFSSLRSPEIDRDDYSPEINHSPLKGDSKPKNNEIIDIEERLARLQEILA